MNNENVNHFVHWVQERHNIWQARQENRPQPWTADPIMQSVKFTNCFRILDPGSQFVLTDLASPEDDPLDVIVRLFLYRYTNRPSTWESYDGVVTADSLLDFHEHMVEWRRAGNKVFSGAYMIVPQPGHQGDKVQMVIELAQRLIDNGSFEKFLEADNQPDRHEALRDNYGVGHFLAMQILTDWGYTSQCGEDREGEFVVFGPGSIRGSKALGGLSIEQAKGIVEMETTVALPGGRAPSLMDVQNCLCEFSKYVKYLDGVKTYRHGEYRAAHPGPQPAPLIPVHFGGTHR